MISKLPSFGFYPSLCSLISNFLYDRYIAAVVDGYCFFPKPINNSVPKGSVLSHTLFLLFINDLLDLTQCLIYLCADDSTLHFSKSFSRRPNQKQVNDSHGDTTECLISNFFLNFRLKQKKTCCSIPQKLNSFIYPLDKIFQTPSLLLVSFETLPESVFLSSYDLN